MVSPLQSAQIAPAPVWNAHEQGPEETTIYGDDAVATLPVANINRTLAGKLCGRLDDVDFNLKIIHLTQRLSVFLHIVSGVSVISILLLYVVSDIPTRTALSFVCATTGLICIFFHVASLSWDMMCLVATTFEFWFLCFITTSSAALWCVIFHDARIAAFVVTGIQFILTLCVDAVIYSRFIVIRTVALSSPCLLAGLVLTSLRYAPDLHYPTYVWFGVRIDAVDMLVNGNLILAYFTTFRAYRSKHLVFSTAPIHWITCDVYFPVCRLVPQSQKLLAEEARRRLSTQRTISHSQRGIIGNGEKELKLLENKTAHGIDARDILLPVVADWLRLRLRSSWLNAIGGLGLGTWLLALAWTLVDIQGHHSPRQTPYYFAVVGITLTSVFAVVHAVHLQRKLVGRIMYEIDAWFISLHISATTFGTCDLLHWDSQRILLVVTAWIWCHWVLFLDALSPFSRRQLALTHLFVLLVDGVLFLYPLLLVYWLCFSCERPTLNNRVILRVPFGDVDMRVEMLGFVGNKVFTLWVWTGRFFWRELLRPVDAFKLIKRRAFYRVNV